jgi:hypothetical protein
MSRGEYHGIITRGWETAPSFVPIASFVGTHGVEFQSSHIIGALNDAEGTPELHH